jgi:glycosyltransferase involved in cell wall biosynthesis
MSNNVDLYYVHLFNDFSGSPRVLRDAIDSEVNDTSSTYVLTSQHAGFLDNVNAQRVNCFYARSSNRYIQLCYYLLSQVLLFGILSVYLLRGLIKGRQSTVVINTMLPFGAGLASKIMRAKVIYYVHETYIKPELLKRFLRFFIEHCATHVIFVSKYLQLAESFSRPVQSVIYNGLRNDFPLITEVNEDLKFSGKQLFFAGSLKLYKGIEQLLQLAELMPEFKVLAAINCEVEELNEFLNDRTVPNNMTFIARPANIQQHFVSSFAVLNLSLPNGWIETFGLSLIEGMAFGSPVVAPPVGGPVEFVNKKNGLLVDSRETEKIVEFIRYLNSSIEVWSSFSEQAFLTSKHFTATEYKKSFKHYFKQYNLV